MAMYRPFLSDHQKDTVVLSVVVPPCLLGVGRDSGLPVGQIWKNHQRYSMRPSSSETHRQDSES